MNAAISLTAAPMGRRCSTMLTAACAILATLAGPAKAITWDAGGANAYWSTVANWAGDTNPLAGDNLLFNSASKKINTNDLLASVGWMHMPSNAYALYGTGAGATVTVGGNITNFGAGNLIGFNMTFAATRTIVVTNGGSLEISGSIGGAGGLNMFGRNHVLTLSGNNTFAGGVNIQSGWIVVKNSASLGTGTKTITMTAGTAGDPRIILDGSGGDIDLPATISFQTSNNNGSFYNAAGNNTIRGNFTLTSGGGDTIFMVTNGTLTLMGTISPNTTARALRVDGAGNGALLGRIADGSTVNTLQFRKMGSGTWTMAGTNTYTRDTSIEGGKLILTETGSIRNSTNINVFAGAVFDVSAPSGGFSLSPHQMLLGSGALTGDVTTVAGSRIAPGTVGTAGTLGFSNSLILATGTTNFFDLSSTPLAGNDRIAVATHVIAAGLIQINPIAGPLDTTAPYRLFDYGGTFFNAFDGVEVINSRYTGTLDTSVPSQVNVSFVGAPLDLVWSGGTANWDVNTTAAWNADLAKFLNPDNVRFDDTVTGGHTVTLTGNLYPSALVVSGATDYAFTGSGRIAGATALVKDGPGNLTLGTSNDFTGGIVLQGGRLTLANSFALPNNTTVTVANGAALDYNGIVPGASRTNFFVVAGDGGDGLGVLRDSLSTNGIAANSAIHSLRMTGPTTLGTGGRFDIGLAGAAGSQLDGGGFILTKIGAGTNDIRVQILTNVQAIAIQAGTLRYESYSHTDDGSAGTTNFVAAGAILEGWGNLTFNMPVVLNGSTLRNGNGAQVWTGGVRLDADSFFDTSAGNITVSGAVSGASVLTKISGNTLVLAGSNSYAGLTVISNGAVQAANSDALGTSSAGTLVVGAGGTTGDSLALAGNITIASEPLMLEGNTIGRAYLRNSSGTNTWASRVDVQGNVNSAGLISDAGLFLVTGDVEGTVSNGAAFFLRGNGTGALSGNLVITGAVSKTEDQTWTIGAPGRLYDWTTVSIARGTLRMGAANTMPATRPVYMGELAINTARFDLNGYDQTIAGLQTNGAVTGAAAVTNTGSAATLTISNSADYVFNKTLADGGPTHELNLVKDGAGIQTFSGANTYRGVTTIKAGQLVLAHPLAAQNTTISNLVPGALVLDGATNAYVFGGLAGGVDLPLANNLGAAVALTVGGNGDNTLYTGVLSGDGSFTKTGTGILELTAVQTYTGLTTLSGGTLRLSGGDNLLPTGMPLMFGGDGTLDLGANRQTFTAVTNFTNGADGAVVGSGRLTVNGDFRIGGTGVNTRATLDMSGLAEFVFDNAAGSVEAGGQYPGGGNPSNATGLLYLARSSVITASQLRVAMMAFPGNNRQQGVLELGQTNDFALGSLQAGNNKSTAQICFRSGLTNPVLRIRGTAGDTSRADVLLGFGGSGIGQGIGRMDLTINALDGTLDALVGLLRAGSSAAGSQGAQGEFRMGAGTLDVTELLLAESTNTNTGAVSGFLGVSGGEVKAQRLTLGQNSTAIATVTGAVAFSGGRISAATIHAGAGTAVRTFNWDAGTLRNYDASTDLDVSGVNMNVNGSGLHIFEITSGRTGAVSAAIQGDGGLIKSGPGVLVLSGSNGYAGPTAVSNGTLRINGTHTGGGTISVFAGGELGGEGSVGSIAVLTGGRLSPGNSPGTLTLAGDLDLEGLAAADSGDFVLDLGVSARDLVNLTSGTLRIGAGILGFNDFTFNDLGDLVPGTYTLVSTPNPVNGSLDPAHLSGTVGGKGANLALADGDTDLVLTIVPEPAALGLLGLGLLALGLRRRSGV